MLPFDATSCSTDCSGRCLYISAGTTAFERNAKPKKNNPAIRKMPLLLSSMVTLSETIQTKGELGSNDCESRVSPDPRNPQIADPGHPFNLASGCRLHAFRQFPRHVPVVEKHDLADEHCQSGEDSKHPERNRQLDRSVPRL